MDIQTGFSIFFAVIALVVTVFAIQSQFAPTNHYDIDTQHEGKLFWWCGVATTWFITVATYLINRIYTADIIPMVGLMCLYAIVPCIFCVMYYKQKLSAGRVLPCDVENTRKTIGNYFIAIAILAIFSVVLFCI
mgnify:CR=1 FL=1